MISALRVPGPAEGGIQQSMMLQRTKAYRSCVSMGIWIPFFITFLPLTVSHGGCTHAQVEEGASSATAYDAFGAVRISSTQPRSLSLFPCLLHRLVYHIALCSSSPQPFGSATSPPWTMTRKIRSSRVLRPCSEAHVTSRAHLFLTTTASMPHILHTKGPSVKT